MKQRIIDATPQNIWNYRQNHPELVVKDIRDFSSELELDNETVSALSIAVRLSLLCRGVNKWLKVRRDLIAYKKQLKHKIKVINITIPILKRKMTESYVDYNTGSISQVVQYHREREQYLIAKESLKLLQSFRSDLKRLCMTERWQVWEGKTLKDMNTIRCSD
jgi:hypothetical protein